MKPDQQIPLSPYTTPKAEPRFRILICSGGTGGHVFPAQALAQQIMQRYKNVEILFAGGGLTANSYFDRKRFTYREVACGNFNWRKPFICLRSGWRIIKGFIQSIRIIRSFKPNLVVGFGSYYTVPTLLAAKMMRIPIVLHAADSIPGKVVRWLSKYAVATGINFPEAAHHLKGKSVEVGIPLREGYRKSSIGRKAGLEYFGLDSNRLTLLVFGGSQGALAINKMVVSALTQDLKPYLQYLQVIHYTGQAKNTEWVQKMYQENGVKACVKDFEKRMDFAWNVADLAISRSGASSIAEQIEFEVPGILIPYPFAMDNHQELNAEYFVTKIGGALRFSESQLNSKKLAEVIEKLITDNQSLLRGMQQAIRLHKHRPQQQDLCTLVHEILTQH